MYGISSTGVGVIIGVALILKLGCMTTVISEVWVDSPCIDCELVATRASSGVTEGVGEQVGVILEKMIGVHDVVQAVCAYENNVNVHTYTPAAISKDSSIIFFIL